MAKAQRCSLLDDSCGHGACMARLRRPNMECLSALFNYQCTRPGSGNVDIWPKDPWHLFGSWRHQLCRDNLENEAPRPAAHEDPALCLGDSCYVTHDNRRNADICCSTHYAVH